MIIERQSKNESDSPYLPTIKKIISTQALAVYQKSHLLKLEKEKSLKILF